MQTIAEVDKALLGIHDEGSSVNVLLRKKFVTWEELSGALFEVQCYLKS